MLKADPLAHSESFIRRVYADGAYRVGDGPEAKDRTLETFERVETLERALRYRSSFDSCRGDAAAWLVGVAQRCIADAVLARTASLEDVAGSPAPGGLEGDAVGPIQFAAALATLDERKPCAADTANGPAEPGATGMRTSGDGEVAWFEHQ